MPKQTILDNEFVTLWFYPEQKMVYHQLKKYVPSPNMQEMLLKGLEFFKSGKANKWLSDDSKLGGALGQDMKDWNHDIWLPRMVAAGWKYWALVMPASAIGKMNLQRMAGEFAQKGVTFQPFSNPAAAMTWLDKQK